MEEFDRIDNSYILVEFAGARKWILKEKLSAAEDMAAHMRKWQPLRGIRRVKLRNCIHCEL